MSNEQIVKERFPGALLAIERNNNRATTYRIRYSEKSDDGDTLWQVLAEAKSPEEAWRLAAKKVTRSPQLTAGR